MTILPEDVLFTIGQYGGKSRLSERRWYDELVTLDSSFDLRSLLALQRRWLVEDIGIKGSEYYSFYDAVKHMDYDILYSDDNAYFYIQLSPEESMMIDPILDKSGLEYIPTDEGIQINLGKYPRLLGYLGNVTAHNLMKPTSFYTTYRYGNDIVYLGTSNYIIPYDLSPLPVAPYEQSIIDILKRNDPSFALQDIYLWRYKLRQHEKRLPSDLKAFMANYKGSTTRLVHSVDKHITYLDLGYLDDIDDIPLPKGWVHDEGAITMMIVDKDQSIFWGIISLLWDRQLFTLDPARIDGFILPYR